jgi:hypothetical protein
MMFKKILMGIRECLKALVPEDHSLDLKKVKFDRFIPYDVVIETKVLKQQEATRTVTASEGKSYTIGIVVGFEKMEEEKEPTLIKVAYFNNDRTDSPVIKVHHADNLTLLQSPLDQMQVLAALYSMQPDAVSSPALPKKTKETVH